jgi:hypothetical protein
MKKINKQVFDQVNSTWIQISNRVRYQVKNNVRNQVWFHAAEKIRQIEDQLGSRIRDQVKQRLNYEFGFQKFDILKSLKK